MHRFIIFLIVVLIIYSCSNKSKHENLIAFKQLHIAEFREEEYFKLEEKLEQLEVKYLNDIIYITYLTEHNACGEYDGNIKITNDTIKLKVNLNSDIVCKSTSIVRITFIINNTFEKEKKIIIE